MSLGNGNDPFWGIGFEYKFNLNFALYAEYEDHRFDISDVSLFAGGVKILF